MSLVDAATVVVGTCTVLGGPHPLAANAAFLLNALRPKLKFVSVIGSFGWASKAVENLAAMLTAIKPEILAPVYVKGLPRPEDYQKLAGLAETITGKHAQIELT
jgi:flavorubredoxin